MIKLEIKKYCQNCTDFVCEIHKESRVSNTVCFGLDPTMMERQVVNDTIVRCANRDLCKRIYNCIKESELK